jgi:transcriptional regulator with XRE-family HTH domain
MTLKQVEQASGLSATHLSEIERGRTSPTIGALVRIARALEKDASYFIEHEEMPEVAHLPREAVRSLKVARGVTAERLTPGIPGGLLLAYRVVIEGGAEWRQAATELDEDATYLVRRGSIEARFGDEEVRLDEGDAAQASLEVAHTLRSPKGASAELYALMTRPIEES